MPDLMTPCKECKKEVSKTAKTCPHCGEANPRTDRVTTGCFGIVIIVLVIMILASIFSDAKEENTTNDVVSNDTLNQTSSENVETHTHKNMQQVVSALSTHYNIEAKNEVLEGGCISERFCEVFANKVQIQAVGFQVTALTSSKVRPSLYQQMCSGIFIALTGSNQELAEVAITQGFNAAAQNGQSKFDVLGIGFSVKPSFNGLLECSFVKYP